MTLQCVILAGGLGTRMRPVTETIPKALVPVLGVPFVDWQLQLLAGQGIDRVLLSVGYRGDMLRQHLGDGSRFGLRLTWIDEGCDLRGTGGALRLALDAGALEDDFFVLYGDSYLPIAMADVERAWQRCHGRALMTVMRNEGRWDASNVILSEERVVLYDKSRPARRRREMRWIDYGLSILTADVIARRTSSGSSADLADILRELSVEGTLAAFEVAERFYEAGSPDGLADLEAYLSKHQVSAPRGAAVDTRPPDTPPSP